MAGTNGVLGPVTLRVADLGRQLAFYSDVLGLAAAAEGRDAGAVAMLRAGREALLQLQAVPGAPSPPPGCTGLYHVALRLPHR
ncbi:MAG: VOC family protein, partial [Clostridia bacterium]|nr:VOC family protein [Clostridia bacterium]